MWDDLEFINTKKILDTVFNFKIDDLSPVNYQAKTLNLFELNNFIRYLKEQVVHHFYQAIS